MLQETHDEEQIIERVAAHMQPGDEPDRMGFRTKLEPGHLTDMIATAAAIAELEVVKRSAQVFGWTIDETQINNLLAEARAQRGSGQPRRGADRPRRVKTRARIVSPIWYATRR